MSLKNNLSILQIVKLKIIDFQYFSVLFFFSFSAQNSSFQVIPLPTIGKHLLFYRNINNDTFKSNSDKVLQYESPLGSYCRLPSASNHSKPCLSLYPPKYFFCDKSDIYHGTFLVFLCANVLTSKVCWSPFRRTFVVRTTNFSSRRLSVRMDPHWIEEIRKFSMLVTQKIIWTRKGKFLPIPINFH